MQPPPGFSPYAPPAIPEAFAPPTDGTLPGAQTALYTPGHVALATFFGTTLGGAVLLAMNERRLGRAQAATLTLVFGVLATIALVGVGFLLPDNFPSAPLGIAPLFVMRAIAQKRQSALVKAHTAAGGKVGSGWAAFGIAMACLAAVLVPVFVVAFVVTVAGAG